MGAGNPIIEDKSLDILKLVSVPADTEASGHINPMILGETFTAMQTGYLKSDEKIWLSDADAAATMPIVVMVLVAGNADDVVNCLFSGFARDDTWTWTVGGEDGKLYAHTTPGALVQAAPSGSGDQVQAVAIATHANRIFFNPEYTLIEVA